MKIKLLPLFKTDIDNISKIELVINGGRNCRINLFETITNNNIKSIEIHDNLFNDCYSIQYEVTYKNKILKTFKFESKEDSVYVSSAPPVKIINTKINLKSPYKNTDADKTTIVDMLFSKIEDVYKSSENNYGDKNLIYYSVFGKGYADLFETSFNTIKTNSEIFFDVLVITDIVTKSYIESKGMTGIKFHIVNTPEDGISASMTKTRIFEWELINEYRKILFLDCDIICLKDMKPIFDGMTKTNKLYTVFNPTVNTGSFLTLFHGLNYRSQEIKDKADLKGYRPLNAGQFSFLNSSYMQKHFENLNWVMNIWSGLYFFEQSFLNVYSVITDIIDQSLNDYFIIANATVTNPVKVHNDKSIFVHFTSPALDADTKIDFINRYINLFC